MIDELISEADVLREKKSIYNKTIVLSSHDTSSKVICNIKQIFF